MAPPFGSPELFALLTRVVESNPAFRGVDLDRARGLVDDNLSVFVRRGELQLEPLLRSLRGRLEPSQLEALGVELERAAKASGIPCRSGREPSAAPRPAATPAALQREPTASRPAIPHSDRRQRVSQELLQAIRSVERLDPDGKASFAIHREFRTIPTDPELSFDFVRKIFRERKAPDDLVYAAYLRFRQVVEPLGVAVADFDAEMAATERAIVEKREQERAAEEASVDGEEALAPPPDWKKDLASSADAPRPGPIEARPKLPWRWIRLGVMAGVLVTGLVLARLLTPVEPLDPKAFDAVIPTQRVELHQGRLILQVDVARWVRLAVPEREAALASLATLLAERQLLVGAVLTDEKRNGVAWEHKQSAIHASRQFLYRGTDALEAGPGAPKTDEPAPEVPAPEVPVPEVPTSTGAR